MIKSSVFLPQNFMLPDDSKPRSKLSVQRTQKTHTQATTSVPNKTAQSFAKFFSTKGKHQRCKTSKRRNSEPQQPECNTQNPNPANSRRFLRCQVESVRVLENWVNQALQTACITQKFKISQQQALKSFLIDQKNLSSRGFSNQQIVELYKSLFVHSQGLSSKLTDLLSNKSEAVREEMCVKIWSVFSYLLQFASKGVLQTVIGSVQKQSNRRIETMQQIAAGLEQQIRQNQKGFLRKHQHLIQELRQEKETKSQLQLLSSVLQEELRVSEVGFSNEAQLRLRFEHRINEVHTLHAQLLEKHKRLLQNFQESQSKLQLQSQQHEQKKLKIERLQHSNYLLKDDLDIKSQEAKVLLRHNEELKSKIKHLHERNQQLTKQRQQDQLQISKLINQVTQKQSLLNASIVRFKLLEQDRSKYECMVAQSQSGHKEVLSSRLQLQRQLQQLSLSHSQLQKDYCQFKIHLEASKNLYRESQSAKAELEQRLSLQIKDRSKLNQLLRLKDEQHERDQTSLLQLNEDIATLRKQNQRTTEEADFQSRTLQAVQKKLRELEKSVKQSESKKVQQFEQRIILLNSNQMAKKQLDLLKRNLLTLSSRSQAELQQSTRSLAALNNQLQRTVKEFQALKKQNQQLQQQNFNIKKRLSDSEFQYQDLNKKYEQSLLFVDSEKDYLKNMSIQFQTNKSQLLQFTRNCQILQLKLVQNQEAWNAKSDQLNSQIQFLQGELNRRSQHVHPMIYWQLYSHSVDSQQKHVRKQSELQDQLFVLNSKLAESREKTIQLQNEIITSNNQHQLQLQIAQQKFLKLEQHMRELHQRSQKARLTKVKDLIKDLHHQPQSKEVQEEIDFYQLIEEKNKAIEVAYKKLQNYQLQTKQIREEWDQMVHHKQIINQELQRLIEVEAQLKDQNQSILVQIQKVKKQRDFQVSSLAQQMDQLRQEQNHRIQQLHAQILQFQSQNEQLRKKQESRLSGRGERSISSREAKGPRAEQSLGRGSIYNKLINARKYYS